MVWTHFTPLRSINVDKFCVSLQSSKLRSTRDYIRYCASSSKLLICFVSGRISVLSHCTPSSHYIEHEQHVLNLQSHLMDCSQLTWGESSLLIVTKNLIQVMFSLFKSIEDKSNTSCCFRVAASFAVVGRSKPQYIPNHGSHANKSELCTSALGTRLF